MGIQQMHSAVSRYRVSNEYKQCRSCMAIIWVQRDDRQFDRTELLETIRAMPGVLDANFGLSKPAILMIDYRVKEISAVNLIMNIRNLGVYAKIVGC